MTTKRTTIIDTGDKKSTTKKSTTTPKESLWNKTKQIARDERTQFVCGLILVISSIFLTISFISFFFSGAADYSIVNGSGNVYATKNGINNWAGIIGARCANFFINRWVGISAFFFIIFIARIGLKMMKVINISITRSLAYTCAFVIVGSLLCGFIGNPDSYIWLGGQHGYYMTEWLKGWAGTSGTLLVIITGVLLILIALTRRTMSILRRIFDFHWIKMPKWEKESKTESNTNNDEEPTNKKNIVTTPDTNNTGIQIDAPEEAVIADNTNIDDTPIEPVVILQEPNNKQAIIEESDKNNEHKDVALENNDDPQITIVVGQEEVQANKQSDFDEYDPTLDLSFYKAPTFDLLREEKSNNTSIDTEEQEANKQLIISTLRNYGITISEITATVGPTVTLYEIVPEAGVRIARIKNLEDDIALSLAALGIRIIAPIPGKGTVGIEVPNKKPQMVSMRPIIASKKFQECDYELPIALGKTITNEIYMVDLCKMPHILVAGATGQGKSVGLNAIVTSLLYKKHPSQLKFVMVDPKKVEFSIYSSIERHFLAKLPDSDDVIITDTDKVVQTLNSVCREMDTRYDLLKAARTRNIKEYNAKFIARQLNPEKGHHYMPYIVVIVDEFGDLIMTAGREVEMPIARIAQLARAVGIHMIIATQRPSTNIITGSIKANFPARIAFKVASMVDSRTILDSPGANQLIGKGDMLVLANGNMTRVQCAFVDTPEVENICQYIEQQQGYPTAFLLPEYSAPNNDNGNGGGSNNDMGVKDPLFEEAARLIVANQSGSTSLIQRRFSIGYNRAGRLMDQLEQAGIVGPFEGSKARQVLVIDDIHLEQILEKIK